MVNFVLSLNRSFGSLYHGSQEAKKKRHPAGGHSHLHKKTHCLLGPILNMDNFGKLFNPLKLFIGLRSHSKLA